MTEARWTLKDPHPDHVPTLEVARLGPHAGPSGDPEAPGTWLECSCGHGPGGLDGHGLVALTSGREGRKVAAHVYRRHLAAVGATRDLVAPP